MARKFPAWLTLVGIMVLAAAVLVKGQKAAPGDPAGSRLPALRPTGQPQLVSVEPLPGEMGGEMCEWLPASSQERLVAAIQQEPAAARAASPADTKGGTAINRAPVRMIRDPYANYSAVVVDPLRNEIVLQDENLFQIMRGNTNTSIGDCNHYLMR